MVLRACPALVGVVALLAASEAAAFEFFDGRLQFHGYLEIQLRTIANNFDADDPFILTQWYNVFNLEIEADIAPDGWGPFDLISSYLRAEVRYDCVWTRACGTLPRVDAFGDRSRSLPDHLTTALRTGLTGATFTGDTRQIHGIQLDKLGFEFKDFPVGDTRRPAYLWHFPGVDTLFGVPGSDGQVGTDDDPAFFTFERFVTPGEEYRFALRQTRGPKNGQDLQGLGPWEPRNEIFARAALAEKPNPFNPMDFNPIAGPDGSYGSQARPYRPSPLIEASAQVPKSIRAEARGLFMPNETVSRMMTRGEFDNFDQNFSQNELSWNRGASQQQTKELKEFYFDLEMFDSRLWLRLGKQNIVWGKTELFRTTDQFNPQDLALSSLPSLEESRIPLWAARAVYSFYSVGPLEDLRVELAANFDSFQPTDLGRCGEPYTPNPVCNKSAGLFAHGLAGFGLAGEVQPSEPWDDVSGVEVGGRVEFRWDRYSFAISDFWGYDDFPYVDQVFLYERNVDPRTGRPRRAKARGGCDPEGLFDGDTSSCLEPDEDALFHHPANQQRFAMICSSSVGFSDLDPSVCAQSVFNSESVVSDTVRVVTAFGTVFGGTTLGALLFSQLAEIPGALAAQTLAGLNQDPGDCVPDPNCGNVVPGLLDPTGDPLVDRFMVTGGVERFLTNEQEALLGCGPLFGTRCSVPGGGVDLLNAELSVLAQSWPGFPGAGPAWDTRSPIPQPGTQDFFGGTVATRFVDGRQVVLTGAHGPAQAGYDPLRDGCVGPTLAAAGCNAGDFGRPSDANLLVHPYTGQPWKNEMAAVSWNLLVTLVALSGLGTPLDERNISEFVPSEPFRTNGCSFANPQDCSNVQALYAVAHTQRKDIKAGGNRRFGRTDFDWHVAGSGVLRYAKRNVLGFAMDFAEDTTKSNWSFEFTWINDVPYDDHDSSSGLTDVDLFNLTVSVDRPTFINFLNENRTFFINTQWFFQYVSGYKNSFPSNGPFNVLATLHVDTGYWQDRLLPGLTLVYDFGSISGATIFDVAYRFTENFSLTVGAAVFWGRFQPKLPALTTVADPPFRTGRDANSDFVEEGLSPIRDRDELFLRIRYTF